MIKNIINILSNQILSMMNNLIYNSSLTYIKKDNL